MQQRLLLWLFATLLGLSAAAAADCVGAAETGCSAFASLDITTTGGTCTGSAGATCEAVSSSQNAFQEAYEEWWAEGKDACTSEAIEAAATAVAVAIAEVWTSAAAKVTCEGYGFGCGWAIADGKTFALGFAEALASAAAEAVGVDAGESFCYADIRAVSTVLAEAASAAQESACVDGQGSEEGFKESYVKSVAVAVADAFASATATVCEADDEVAAESLCFGDATSTTDDAAVFLGGDECAGTRDILACVGPGKDACCDPDMGSSLCICEDCDGPWTKTSKGGDAKKVFENKSKDLCFCVDTADDSTPLEIDETPDVVQNAPDVVENAPDIADEETSMDAEDAPSEGEETPKPATGEIVEEESDSIDSEEPSESVPEEGPVETSEEPTEVIDPDTTEEQPAASAIEAGEATEPSEGIDTDEEDAGPPPPECPGAVDTSCSAFSTLDILVTGGKCSGKATASCDAVTSSQNQFKEAYDEWFSEDGVCKEGKATAAAEAVAQAIAKVWADAAVQVTCEGLGFACGWTASGGQAWAIGFAEALAQAAAEAGGGGADGFCYADIRSVSVVIAEAAANAQAAACTTGGSAEDFQESYAAALEIGIATAFAEATAFACDAGDEVTAGSRCEGKATSETFGDSYATDDACAGVSQVKSCAGPGKEMCCSTSFTRSLCVCNRVRCENGPWVMKTDYDEAKNTKRSFEDRKKNVCFCLD